MIFEHIRGLREDHDLSQKELAKLLHMAQNTYSQYETGVIEWTAPILLQLADFYNVSVDYLMDRTNQKAVNR
jgi:transcriptional regulator with XRE-family HTH domain